MLSNAIVLAYALDVVWMVWLIVVAVRMRGEPASQRLADAVESRQGAVQTSSR